MIEIKRKKDGFTGQICVVVPPFVVESQNLSSISKSYFITDIGYFPKAEQHYRQRVNGCREHILIHCVDGKGKIIMEQQVLFLKPNEFVLIPADVPHTYAADKDDPWSIYWLHFGGVLAGDLVWAIRKNLQTKNNTLIFNAELHAVFEKMYNLLSTGYSKVVMESVSLILPYFLQFYLYPTTAYAFDGRLKPDVVQESIQYLKTKLRTKVSLEEIAANRNLSVSHFSKIFKQTTGYSPIAYLNHLKIQEACSMLRFSTHRISEISFELGFEDPYYFSRLFKEHMGVSPIQYRKGNAASGKIIH